MNSQGQESRNEKDARETIAASKGKEMNIADSNNQTEVAEEVNDDDAEIEDQTDDNRETDDFRQQTINITDDETAESRNEDPSVIPQFSGKRRNNDICSVPMDQAEVMQSEVEATVRPADEAIDKTETVPELNRTFQRFESSQIRERRLRALEDINDAAYNCDNDVVRNKEDNEKREGPTDENLRYSIQETDQFKVSEIAESATESSENMETEVNILREKKQEEEEAAKLRRDSARQSCEDMGYSEEDIDWAVQKYEQEHSGSDNYKAMDLASLIENMHTDTSNDSPALNDHGASHDPCLQHEPEIQHETQVLSQNNNNNQSIDETIATGGATEYTVTAKIKDLGHPRDMSSDHIIQIELPLLKNICHEGCNLKFDVKTNPT